MAKTVLGEDEGCFIVEDPNLPQNKTTQEKYAALAIRASCENDLDLWQAAMADENAAIAMLPNSSWAYWYRGLTYGGQHSFGAELADLNKAIALAPTDIRPLLDRIRLYEFEHHYADAARDDTTLLRVESAIPLDQDGGAGPGDYNIRCWDRAHTPNLSGALSDCQKAIALLNVSDGFNPANKGEAVAEIYDSAGYVHLKLKHPAKAIFYYSAALSAHPKFASSLYGRALAEQALGQTAAATTDLLPRTLSTPK
jgi:tetratricopeptide (TPR) repeat protein